MLLCRTVLAVASLSVWQMSAELRGTPEIWVLTALVWPAVTAASMLAPRVGRRSALAALTFTLLGDGVLLTSAWWATGAIVSPIGYLVALHVVAVTLLASFRTGVKLAVWHSICSMLFLEATAAGMLGPAEPVPLVGLGLYLGALWTMVLGTASFAAANERELRRRRYDSEVLRELGLTVGSAQEHTAVAVSLARFVRDELSARRTVVLVYVQDGEQDGQVSALGVVADDEQDAVVHHLDESQRATSVVTDAVNRSATILLQRFKPDQDRWLAGTFSGADGLVVVPFAVDHVFGALVMEPDLARGTRRVERRLVNTAEQATAHAAVALERAVLTERIRVASETDGLTRVANRRRFDAVLLAELQRARESGDGLALAMIDVDFFKRFNDTHGHQVGDHVLRQVAQAIRAECGEPHLVARYGGEEFAAILVGVDTVGALAIAERIRAGISAADTAAPVTASLGVAFCPAHGDQPADLLAAADAALYRAKAGGRDRVVLADPAAETTPAIAEPSTVAEPDAVAAITVGAAGRTSGRDADGR
jgi:diguanylate cyclase (GGDEF)-like protein